MVPASTDPTPCHHTLETSKKKASYDFLFFFQSFRENFKLRGISLKASSLSTCDLTLFPQGSVLERSYVFSLDVLMLARRG